MVQRWKGKPNGAVLSESGMYKPVKAGLISQAEQGLAGSPLMFPTVSVKEQLWLNQNV